jgi:glutathione S-transferase
MAEKRSGNPFQSFLGDVASSIVGGVSGAGNTSGNTNTKELDDKLSNKNTIPTLSTWEEIKTKLESIQTNEEKAFCTNVAKGIGKASPLNKIRSLDESNKEEDIRVTLYRDSASWCPCKFLFFSFSIIISLLFNVLFLGKMKTRSNKNTNISIR